MDRSAVQRHARACVPGQIELAQAERGESVIERLEKLNATTLKLLQRAEAKDDRVSMLGAIRETCGNLLLMARLTGQLQEPLVNVNVQPATPEAKLEAMIRSLPDHVLNRIAAKLEAQAGAKVIDVPALPSGEN